MMKISSIGVQAQSTSSVKITSINSGVDDDGDNDDNVSNSPIKTISNSEDSGTSKTNEETQRIGYMESKKKGRNKSETYKTHTEINNGKAVKIYECSLCSKTYVRTSGLKRHILSSHDNYHWRCLVCQMTFVSKENAERHIKKNDKHKYVQEEKKE